VTRGLSLKWQAVLIALGALLLSHVVAIAVYTHDRDDVMATAAIQDVAERMASYIAISADLAPDTRRHMLQRVAGRVMSVSFDAPLDPEACRTAYPQKGAVDHILSAAVPAGIAWTSCVAKPAAPARRLAQSALPFVGEQRLLIAFRFPDQNVTLDGVVRDDPPFLLDSAVLYILLVGLIASGAAYWLILRATRPLSRFGEHAAEVGRNLDSPPLTEDGPGEVRSAARAFNRMHAQLKRFIHGRTGMLAAISHDLRTPIARLRLRTEMLPDTPDRAKLLATLEEMEEMANAVLVFVRGATPPEAQRTIELGSLIDSICSDLADAGMPVAFLDGQREIRYSCRPPSMRRAVTNLIDNAVKYGGSAEVRLRQSPRQITIEVLDRGPGLAPDQIDQVVLPFYRGEASRNRETGGYGLGLSIAASIVNAHGGELIIRNREGGGLSVSLDLPL